MSTVPSYVERQLEMLDELTAKIVDAERELAQLAKQNECTRRMMTVPGVGPVTAAMVYATLDDVRRFKTAHAVESYLGLTPGESSSGETIQRMGITRAGSVRARTILVQAAWVAWRTRPNDPMVQWARQIATRRPKQIAIVALARKMVGVMFAIWRDETSYSPMHGNGVKQQ